MRRALLGICLAALVVLSGCSGVFGGGEGASPTADGTETTGTPASEPTETATSTESPTETATPTETTTTGSSSGDSPGSRPDPRGDTIGWENGYWYDDPIDVEAVDGLNDSEFAAAKARTMARVERIRDREFERNISVTFITREELLDRGLFRFSSDPGRDQFWEAAFMVGENETSATALNQLYSVVVDGYAQGNRVVMVAENPESPRLDPAVISHEMAHALGGPRLEPDSPISTRDDRLAFRSVFEGNANFVEGRYLARCEANWSCIERPPNASEVVNFDVNMGLYLWFAAPYTIGPPFMQEMYRRGGNEAIDEAYRTVPASTELFIHPEKYPDDQPSTVEVPDRSTDDWSKLGQMRGRQTNEFGEAILYSTLKSNGVIDGPEPDINKAQRTGLNYTHPATVGWEGDTVVAYRNGDQFGYVFASTWESEEDATEFRQAYLSLLEEHGATAVSDGVYRIPDGPFADAFRVVQQGDRVVVVNAPTVGALDEIHPQDGS